MDQLQNHDMQYNSQTDKLLFPEYGRNVQQLVRHAKTIEDDELRQAFIEHILDLIQQMNPAYKNTEELRTKLWKHIFRICDFELDVKAPEGLDTSKEFFFKKPDVIEYPSTEARFRHYGHNVQKLIGKALEIEPGEKRDAFVRIIGSYMKLAYKTWNRDYYVNDEVVKSDLKTLSNGEIDLDESVQLNLLQSAAPTTRRRPVKRQNSSRGRNNNRNGRNNNNRSKRRK